MKINFQLTVFYFLVIFHFVIAAEAAESFPFRNVNPGDAVPALTFSRSDSGEKISIGKPGGNITVIAFWGADLPSKKQRSIQALTQIQQLAPFFREKQVNLLTVNVQGDSSEIIKEVATAAGFSDPIYLDPNQNAYGVLGILIMPSVILIDKNGKVVTGLGYSQDMVNRLKGEIEILLGEKNKEQLEAELHPSMIEKSKEEKGGDRHLNLGKIMASKGQLESAAQEYALAIQNNPKLANAHIEYGCVLLQLGKVTEAQNAIDNGLALDPNSLQGEICNAQIRAEKGEIDQAISNLQAMVFRNNLNHHLHYVLGTLYSKKANTEKAAQEFRKAYELLNRQIQHTEKE